MASIISYINPARVTKTQQGSKYGVIAGISAQGVYSVSISGQIVTAQSKVGAIPVGDAVIVQDTGAGAFITSKIGMAEKLPEVVAI